MFSTAEGLDECEHKQICIWAIQVPNTYQAGIPFGQWRLIVLLSSTLSQKDETHRHTVQLQ